MSGLFGNKKVTIKDYYVFFHTVLVQIAKFVLILYRKMSNRIII